MVCKFDPAHGSFDNPMRLARHYQQEHAHQYESQYRKNRYRCRLCGKVVSAAQSHIHNSHSDEPPPPHGTTMIQHFFERVPIGTPSTLRGRPSLGGAECLLCGATFAVTGVSHHFARWHPGTGQKVGRNYRYVDDDAVPAQTPARVDTAGVLDRVAHPQHDPRLPWSVDDIVLPTIEAMAHPGGMIPVAHLAAIFVWREATAAMLAAVSHG